MILVSNLLVLALIAADGPKPANTPVTTTGQLHGTIPAGEVWQMTLPEAIRIALDNSEIVRVLENEAQGVPMGGFEPTPLGKSGGGVLPPSRPAVVISRVDVDRPNWKFKAEIMAHVRSIEQQYWALSQQYINLWSRETAFRLGTEILTRLRVENAAGRGTDADVAEAEQQLDNYKLNLISATSDLITTEKQRRNLIGLPPADHRRIVPCSPPIEAKLEPNWDESVAAMLDSQPDLAYQRQLIGVAEMKAILDGENTSLPLERREASRSGLEQQQVALRQILHQTTHSLARDFHNVGASYDQFRTAQQLRAAAQKRLEAQRAFYDEGQITVDRLLDAVTQYANGISQESQYKTTYNASIAAFEEAKGTLLAYEKITILDQPGLKTSSRPSPKAKLDPVVPVSFEEPVAVRPATAAAVPPAPTLYKLKAKLGGEKVLEIEIEVSPTAPVAPGR